MKKYFLLLVKVSFLFWVSACGYDFCILGTGDCSTSSVQSETKKTLDISFAPTEIFSNPINGVNFTDLNLTGGVSSFKLSITNTETAANLLEPPSNITKVFSVTTTNRKVRVIANTGVTAAKDIIVTVTDSDTPATTKKIVITVKP